MKRTLALLLCSLLILSAFTANAAITQDIFDRGHALQWTLNLAPEADALLSLLQGDTPLPTELSEYIERLPSPRATDEAIKILAKGISKIRFSGSFVPWAANLSLGTEQADLASSSIWADAKTGGNGITADLIDALFFLPQDKVKPVLDASIPCLSLDIPGLIIPYLVLLRDEADKLLQEAVEQQGNYPMGELGSFDSKASLIITTHDAARVLKSLLTAFEHDYALQMAISQITYLSSLTKDGPGIQDSVSMAAAKSLKDLIHQLLLAEETYLLELSAYSREGLDSLCYVVDTSKVQEEAALRLAILPDGKQGGLILTAGNGYKLDGTGTSRGVDWEKVRTQVMEQSVEQPMEGSGEQSVGPRPMEESAHLALQYAVAEDNSVDLSLYAYSAGICLFGVTAEHKTWQAESYQSDTAARISVFSKEPALSLSLRLEETDKLPALPDTFGWPVLSLLDSELQNKVDTSNMLSVLTRRFSKAFPDTAEELVKAVQSFDN